MSKSTKLSEICKIKGGSGFPEKYQGKKSGKYPFIKVSDMNLPGNERSINLANNYVDDNLARLLGVTIFPKDTIVFAKVGAAVYLNKRRILSTDTIIDNNMMGVIPHNIDCLFLYQLLLSVDLSVYIQPGALPSVNQNIVGNLIVPSYSLNKQIAIRNILNTIDRTIAKTEALIKKYQQIKAGLMHDLFTRGIGADGKLRPRREEAPELYRESAIGWIPKEWNCVNASEICYPVTKGTTPSFFEKSRTDESIPYIRVENLSFDGTLIFNNESLFISQYIQNFELQRSKIYPDDILINIVGPPLGKVSIVPDTYKDWNANQAIAIYRILNDINRDYLLYYLLSEFSSNWFYIRSKQTSGQVNLTLEMCNELKIPLPSESNEVIEISQRLSSLFEIIRSEKKRLSKLKKQKSGLMHDLLTGKVSINVDSDAP